MKRIVVILSILDVLGLLFIYWGSGGSKFQTGVATVMVAKAEEQSEAPKEDSPASVAERLGNFSAYTAEEAQTDSRPSEMANGEEVYIGAVANNCLPFGTKIEVVGVVYTVADRMNRRYACNHFDIYFESKDEAMEFGRRSIGYTII